MKFIYLPVEFVSRELDGYTLIAYEALSRNISVVIGPRYQLLECVKTLPMGVFFLKSIRPAEQKNLQEIKDAGHKIVWQDMEGLVQFKFAYTQRVKYNVETIKFCDQIFTVNSTEFENLSAYVDPKKMSTTGSARFEFCYKYAKPFYAVAAKKNILLYTTSFGNVNTFHGGGFDEYKEMLNSLSRGNANLDEEIALSEMMKYYFFQYEEILNQILIKDNGINIIFRPHLSENIEYWKNKFYSNKNLTIKPYEAVHKWLVQSQNHIHFNSTTAIEAALLGIPTHMVEISKEYARFELPEVNQVSYLYQNPQHLMETMFSGENLIPKQGEALQLFDGPENSAEVIVESIEFPNAKGNDLKIAPDLKKQFERRIYELKYFHASILLL